MLANIRDLAQGLVHDLVELSKTFDYEGGPLRNVSECYALSLKHLSDSIKEKDKGSAEEVSIFYNV